MNGKIWVESSVGLGSKFYFTVSIDKCNRSIETDESIKEDNNKKNQTKTTRNEKRVLLVEDNKMNIEITTELIKELGYICDVAEEGISCIKKVQQVGTDYYDLVLMDIHLPKYNGYEISKILKQDIRNRSSNSCINCN